MEGKAEERKRAELVGQQGVLHFPQTSENSTEFTIGVNGLFVELSEGRKTKRSQLIPEFLLKALSPQLTLSSFGGVDNSNK